MIKVGSIKFRTLAWLCVFTLVVVLLLFPVISASAQSASLVHVEKVSEAPLRQTVPVIGRLVSLRSGSIAARIGGPVRQVLVEVGDRVAKGQLIALLDSETMKADLQLAESEIDAAEADYRTWAAEAEVAHTNLRRQQGLRKSVAFSQAKFEDAQKLMAVANAKVKRAEANVAIKRAALKRKKLDVEYASIRAPYDGVVVQRHTEAGSFVEKGAAVVRLIGDRALEVEADVPYKRIAGLSRGRMIRITLDDGSEHKARVRSVLPSENPLTRTRTVRFTPIFRSNTGQLAESQSVTLFVPIGIEKRVLTVHKDAILKRPSGDQVFVVDNGKALPRTVTLGAEIGSRIEVLGGLKKGDVVVTRGNERLVPGASVRVEKSST